MENQSTQECETCGRKVVRSGVKLSSIEFRRKINSIKTMEEFIQAKNYLAQFVKGRFQLKECVDDFLKRLEDQFIINDSDIDEIKIWILSYRDKSGFDSKGMLLGKDPESPLYDFLRLNYSDIDESFYDFYENYVYNIDNPLNKNHASRALNALGLKPVMKKVRIENDDGTTRRKCIMVLYATKEKLSEILRKNGYP